MKIALVIDHAADHPSLPALRALLAGVDHVEVVGRPCGEIRLLPCIAALDTSGIARESGGADLTTDILATWAAASDPVIPAAPKILTKPEFNKHGWAKIGMAAFQKILEDTRKSTGTQDADYEARAAVEQYDGVSTFAKDEVEAIGVKIKLAGFMTQEQFDAITGENWPTLPAA